jgi:hypothetical protein
MKMRQLTSSVLLGVLLAGGVQAATAKQRKAPESDLTPKELRRQTVETANVLAKVTTPPPLPDDLPLPFNPQNFNRREAPRTDATVQTRVATGDHEILEEIAPRVTPTGTLSLGGEHYLQFSKKRLKVGDNLTVTHAGQDYVLELTAIDATKFTLRLNREEITRPIKPGKNP